MSNLKNVKQIQTVVIGGGQAGLSVGYHLAKRGLPFVILDAQKRVGDAWRNRWDSLRLFTTARYAGLPGLPFPAKGDVFPSKDEMADYLESYASRFQLPVRLGERAKSLSREGERFVVIAGEQRYEAEQVVVAMANYQTPRVPEFSRELDGRILQMHSSEYRNPSQLQDGGVLVVGVGNSGADIGLDVASTRPTWVAGKEPGHLPFAIESFFGRFVMARFVKFMFHHILTLSTPIGRKARPKILLRAAPLIRVKPEDLVNAGIERVSRVVGVREGLPLLADGRKLNVRNVIWCTGYHPGFSWIDLPVFASNEGKPGEPLHERGIVTQLPGLYFVGLHFLYAMSSAQLIGVGRDAERIVEAIDARVQLRTASGHEDLQGLSASSLKHSGTFAASS
jgi:putative flavoprotein involved in K+ transport